MKSNKVFFPKDTYKNFVKNLPIVTVDVLFFNETMTETLLFKRANKPLKNVFFSCGGRMIKNENFDESAIRIVREELSLKITKSKLFFGGIANEINKNSIFSGINYHCVDIFFGYILDKKTFKKIQFDNQHNESTWFNIEDEKLHPWIKYKINSLLIKK